MRIPVHQTELDVLRVDELVALEGHEACIDSFLAGLVPPALAFRAIHRDLLWRASDLRWGDYLRRRFKVSPRFAAAILVRAAVEDHDTLGTPSPAAGAFAQEIDTFAEALAKAQVDRGDERWFRVQQAIAHLREARRIVATHLAPHIPESVDLSDWFRRLKQLATDLESTSDARNPHDDHLIGTDRLPDNPYGPRRNRRRRRNDDA